MGRIPGYFPLSLFLPALTVLLLLYCLATDAGAATIRGWDVDGGVVSPMPGVSFFAWPPGEAGYGANVYAGVDLDGDGRDDLVVGRGPDPQAGCPVRVFNFATGSPALWLSLEAYPGLSKGSTVAGGVFHP
jgi:hypothetical protein